MSSRGTYETTLRLSSLDDLFETPRISPFDPEYADHSAGPALEHIAGEIYANGSYQSARATFVAPGPLERSPGEVRDAIGRWASARDSSLSHDVKASRWRGWRSLVTGLLLFVALVALAQLVDDQRDDVLATLAKGLEVAAWVVLWFPLDTLIFSVWQHRLDRRVYSVIRDMEVQLVEAG